MGSATRALMPPKARILGLMEEVGRLEAKALATAPIAVYRVARCGHSDCGCELPEELPMDALVIEMGCHANTRSPLSCLLRAWSRAIAAEWRNRRREEWAVGWGRRE